MSTSATARASTSADRSPENSISPAIALSRQVRRLAKNAVTSARSSPRGSRRGWRARSGDRGCGRARCPSSPSRCAGFTRRAAAPCGIGLVAAGSRIARNANRPLSAAIRRFTVDGASPAQEARNRSSVAVSTASIRRSCSLSQRQNASRSNA